MKFTIILSLCLLLHISLHGQRTADYTHLQDLVDDIYAIQDTDLNYEELYESLLLYYSSPIDLNSVSAEELKALYILSDQQVNSFMNYRQQYGKLLSLYELQAIPTFDLSTIYKLTPFVRVAESGINTHNRPLLKRIWQEPNNYLLLRYERTLEDKKGYQKHEDRSYYKGNPDKLYTRFRTSHINDFSIGITAEKDAGERLTYDKNSHTYGADFYSFHFQLKNKGELKNLVIGDYQIQSGQSLLLAAGFNVGKGAETITTLRRANTGIRPYSSVVEGGFFRGAAATVALNSRFQVTSYYSRLREDARLQSDTAVSGADFISSIHTTGYHRTETELADKDQIVQQSFGGIFLYTNESGNLQIGATLIGDHLSRPLIRPDKPYNRFRFAGTENYNTGLFYSYGWRNFSFFGEMARSKSGGIGAVTGFVSSLTPKLEAAVLIRSYDRDFHSLHGAAFAESAGQNQNEMGWYWGIKYKPSRKYSFTAYFDQFKFPWLKYRVDAPSAGYEYLMRANYTPKRSVLLYAQYRGESKGINPASEDQLQVRTPFNGLKRSYLANLRLLADKKISLQSRVQWSSYDFLEQRTHGFLILQDLNLDLKRLRISTRFALFDTDNYENKQYAYERDVLYAFSLPPYSGRGTRQYLLLQYRVTAHIDVWAKYARTHYRDRETIGTGLEEIAGSVKTDVKLQARIRF
ncbi:hypothetical protein C900_01630 [Fulvivirga imtechensis AK7]|uniref:Helix-hairpin-helix domain-containing protein n=1 Tax=Fulvivirga imtechensis AK7 TaxID=1237149 RepID=L8JVX6_9BACT|nr:helix-hairpin-helix domain-containing protein [Fulvivirga imtechensis]ELR72348.1 hypothetical protein C900_01630 [Fulvivirga imtechensis AK7]